MKFDLVFKDEAHYGLVDGGAVERLTSKVRAKSTVLLTGSPSVFIKRGLKPTAVFSLEELHAAGRASDLTIEVGTSAYDHLEKDYNAKGDLTEEAKTRQTQRATDQTFENLLDSLVKRAKLGRTNMSEGVTGRWNRIQLGNAKRGGLWGKIFGSLQKTIIACNDINQAEQAAAYLRLQGVDVLVSHGGNKRYPASDVDSGNTELFKTSSHPVLIVVDRAQLGYDNPELVNFIDMTGSRNPDRIFQMLCRVVRPSKKDPAMKKLFIKVMPTSFSDSNLLFFMEGVLNLSRREIFETYDGTDIYKGPVPARQSKPRGVDGEGRKKAADQDIVWSPVLEPGMSLFGPSGYFTAISHTNANGYEPIGQVRLGELLGMRQVVAWDTWFAKLKEFVAKHGRRPSYGAKATPEERALNRAIKQMSIPTPGRYREDVAEYWKSLPTFGDLTMVAARAFHAREGGLPRQRNKRFPRPEEDRLACRLRRLYKDPKYAPELRSLGYSSVDEKTSYAINQIKEFFANNNELPHTGHPLYNRMNNYTCEGGQSYRQEFDEWARERGFGADIERSKVAILRVISKTGKPLGTDHPLWRRMMTYILPGHDYYDSDFKSKIGPVNRRSRRTIGPVNRRSRRTSERDTTLADLRRGREDFFVNWIQTHDGYRPNWHADTEEERRLGSELSHRMGTSPEFKKRIRAAGLKDGRSKLQAVRRSGKPSKPFMDETTGTIYPSLSGASRALGISRGAISRVLNGKFKQTNGHTFRYTAPAE